MKKVIKFLFSFLLFSVSKAYTQTLFALINQAQRNSFQAKQSQLQLLISHYSFEAYRAGYKPQLSFYGNVPVYNKDNFQVVQPDGTIKFLSRSQNNSSLGFSFSQPLTFSGGEISLNTDLNRFDDLKTKYTQYNGTPVYIRVSQPLFSYNQYKWDKKIEPLKLEESKRTHIMEMANIACEITKLYFDVLEAQNDLDLAQISLRNADTNYTIERRRLSLGVSTEDKLLQLELQQIQYKQQIGQATYTLQVAELNLKNYLNSNDSFQTQLPSKIPDININLSQALYSARQQRPEILAAIRKRLEAQSNTTRAKADKRQVNLNASYGLNKAADNFSQVYERPNDQQRFSIGLSIPIADWGRRKTKYDAAKAQEELIAISNKLDETSFITEISNLFNSFLSLKNNILLTQDADTIAQKRFAITNRLYQLNNASLLDLQSAQNGKDVARRNYILALRNYWESYFLFKKLTLTQ